MYLKSTLNEPLHIRQPVSCGDRFNLCIFPYLSYWQQIEAVL